MSYKMTSERPRLSIGLAVYDGEQFIRHAIDSLLGQTYRDFNLIISDNGSRDQTEAICREYAERDPRVHYHRNAVNRGLAWNVNRVAELADAEYFKWAAHDDICAPSMVERCIDMLDRTPSAVLCYTDAIIIDESGREVLNYEDRCEAISDNAHERFQIALNNFGLSNTLYGVIRTDALRSTRMLGAYLASDMVLLAELALIGTVVKVPERLFYRRDHPQKAGRANPTDEGLAVWYAPTNKEKIQLRHWRLLREYVACVRRARVPWQQKLRCYGHLGKWCRWQRKAIAAESLYYLRRMSRRGSKSARGAATD
jgi:glycosyltransferase involved in cell wall biosynthesis